MPARSPQGSTLGRESPPRLTFLSGASSWSSPLEFELGIERNGRRQTTSRDHSTQRYLGQPGGSAQALGHRARNSDVPLQNGGLGQPRQTFPNASGPGLADAVDRLQV